MQGTQKQFNCPSVVIVIDTQRVNTMISNIIYDSLYFCPCGDKFDSIRYEALG